MKQIHSLRGFSLLELSIVLVIIGLLAGGVMTGQSLIRASELRAVSNEYQRFLTATNGFRDKYMAIPGDFKNATAFWGKDNANCSADSGTAATPGACNGNGDGALNVPTAAGLEGEVFQFWKHLALAGLIEGSYSGIAGTASVYATTTGVNAPASKMGNGGWYADNVGNYGGDSATFAMDYGNMFDFGGINPAGKPLNPLLTPAEAWNIDTKLDDGKPGYGKVIARFWNVNTCSAADDGTPALNDLAASYRVSDSSAQCALFFRQAF